MKKTLSAVLALSFALAAPAAEAKLFRKLAIGAAVVGLAGGAIAAHQRKMRGPRNEDTALPKETVTVARIDVYNNANQARFDSIMAFAPDKSAITNPDYQRGACVPMTLQTLFEGRYGDVNALSDKLHKEKLFFTKLAGGSDAKDVGRILEKEGYPYKRITDWLKPNLFNDMVKALDEGRAVFIYLDAAELWYAQTGKYEGGPGPIDIYLGAPHLVRAIGIKRKPNGEIDRIGIYDPNWGKASPWVQMTRFKAAMNSVSISTPGQSVFITDNPVTKPIAL